MYFTKKIDEILKELNTTEKGLSKKEAEKRLQENGKNILPKEKRDSIIKIFLRQFTSPLEIILVITVLISFLIGEVIDALVIAFIILIDAIMGTFQENKALKSAETLTNMLKIKAKVIRDNKEIEIEAEDLVVGDIILLESGTKISADARLIDCYNLQIDEISLNRILNKNVSAISPELMVLYHYYLALENIADNYLVDFNQNSLKDYVSIIQGNEETSFRTSEISNSLSRSLINKLYLGIPTNGISKAVQDLVSFINDPSISMFVKAACSLYYVYYVKPTETYSEDLAILTFKYCLAASGLDEVGTLLNFETLLGDKDTFEKELLESQKSLDLTYFLHYVLKNSETIIDNAMKLIGLAKANDVAKEMFQEEKKDVNAMPNLSELEEQIETKSVSSNVKSDENKINYDRQVALDTIPTGLSEQEAKKLEEKLIEMNPNLSYGQAAFYARHCTLGSKYTIAMYKKEIGCAYETARTSMDNLVYLGYYRKELFKNKYIYIPVKKR